MGAKVMLCVDEASARNPELIGLAGENLLVQPWLDVETSAQAARAAARAGIPLEEVWVVSCDDVEPVNLAAAIKRDNPRRRVSLLSAQSSGSLQSRVRAAGIDAALSHQALSERYAFWKEWSRNACGAGGAAGEGSPAANAQVPNRIAASGRPAADAQKRAFLFTVAGGSGGVGKSAAAAVCAAVFAARGRKTLLVDADLQFGDMREAFAAERAFGIDEVVSGKMGARDLPWREGEPCIVAAPRRLERSEEVSSQVGSVIDSLSTHFDVIVANTGAHWGEHTAALLERSSKALFLVDQRASSLRTCKHALELCSRCGIAASPFLFALNRCSKRSPLSSIDVSCALQGAQVFELSEGGSEVEEMLSSGLACELSASRNAFSASVRGFAGQALAEAMGDTASQAEDEAQPRGFFSRRSRKAGGQS